MKRTIAVFLILVMCLTLCACVSPTQSPEEALADKVVGAWYCVNYDCDFWFSDDGTAIATQGSNTTVFTWKVVRDNELLFDFGDDDTELYTISLIDKDNFTFEDDDGYIYECNRG